MRENTLLAKNVGHNKENELISQRNLEFAIYNTTFAGINGEKVYRKIKKPEDLYRLPSDKVEKPLSGEAANAALLASGLVKNK